MTPYPCHSLRSNLPIVSKSGQASSHAFGLWQPGPFFSLVYGSHCIFNPPSSEPLWYQVLKYWNHDLFRLPFLCQPPHQGWPLSGHMTGNHNMFIWQGQGGLRPQRVPRVPVGTPYPPCQGGVVTPSSPPVKAPVERVVWCGIVRMHRLPGAYCWLAGGQVEVWEVQHLFQLLSWCVWTWQWQCT